MLPISIPIKKHLQAGLNKISITVFLPHRKSTDILDQAGLFAPVNLAGESECLLNGIQTDIDISGLGVKFISAKFFIRPVKSGDYTLKLSSPTNEFPSYSHSIEDVKNDTFFPLPVITPNKPLRYWQPNTWGGNKPYLGKLEILINNSLVKTIPVSISHTPTTRNSVDNHWLIDSRSIKTYSIADTVSHYATYRKTPSLLRKQLVSLAESHVNSIVVKDGFEIREFYTWCDSLGIIVTQELPCFGSKADSNELLAVNNFVLTHPSIVLVTFKSAANQSGTSSKGELIMLKTDLCKYISYLKGDSITKSISNLKSGNDNSLGSLSTFFDEMGKPKDSFYYLKGSIAPIHISFTCTSQLAKFGVANNTKEAFTGILDYGIYDLQGHTLSTFTNDVIVNAGTSSIITSRFIASLMTKNDIRNVYMRVALSDGFKEVASSVYYFVNNEGTISLVPISEYLNKIHYYLYNQSDINFTTIKPTLSVKKQPNRMLLSVESKEILEQVSVQLATDKEKIYISDLRLLPSVKQTFLFPPSVLPEAEWLKKVKIDWLKASPIDTGWKKIGEVTLQGKNRSRFSFPVKSGAKLKAVFNERQINCFSLDSLSQELTTGKTIRSINKVFNKEHQDLPLIMDWSNMAKSTIRIKGLAHLCSDSTSIFELNKTYRLELYSK